MKVILLYCLCEGCLILLLGPTQWDNAAGDKIKVRDLTRKGPGKTSDYLALTGFDLEWPRTKYWVKVVTYAAVIFLCRKRCAVGKSMIYMSFLLDESIVCGIDFSNTLQGHTCF